MFLVAAGLLRLGTYIKFIPYPVTVGFSAGIGVIISASQLRELPGLTPEGAEPGPLVEKLRYLWTALPSAVSFALLGAIESLLSAVAAYATTLPQQDTPR